jgi:hypothetical protein
MTPAAQAALAEMADRTMAALATLPDAAVEPGILLERPVRALSVPATELAKGDVLGGERWVSVLYVIVYDGGDGQCVNVLVEDLEYDVESHFEMTADKLVAVLRPEAVSDGGY